MNSKIKTRVKNEAERMKKTKETIRELAKIYHVSKSTVHKDLTDRLKELNPIMQKEIEQILLEHTKERHLRGGESTRKKYKKLKQTN